MKMRDLGDVRLFQPALLHRGNQPIDRVIHRAPTLRDRQTAVLRERFTTRNRSRAKVHHAQQDSHKLLHQ
jgi:hypothetical protein